MVWLGPVGPVDDDGHPVIEVPADLLDEDVDWLNRYSLGQQVRRMWPEVPLNPDPRLRQVVRR